MKKKFAKPLLLSAVIFLSGLANATLLHFDGYINDYSDIIVTAFTLNSEEEVTIWTDSFKNGENFDPITSLWAADGSHLSHNDDNAGLHPTQTRYDSGLKTTLDAGTYYFTISVFNNFPNTTANLFSGPSPFANNWNYGGPTSRKKYYSLWLDGVSTADVISVSEPGAFALFGIGLMGLVLLRRKKTV